MFHFYQSHFIGPSGAGRGIANHLAWAKVALGYAPRGAGYGPSQAVVGKLLGHSDPKTTARYAHIADDPARTAANYISAAFETGLSQQFETAHV